MSDKNIGLFRAKYPIDFDLFDKDSQNVLYIEDSSDQLLTLEIRNASNQDIVLKDLKGQPLSSTNYHFALRFRPGTLSGTSVTGTKTIQLKNNNGESTWELLQGPHDNVNWDVIYLRKTKDLLLECATPSKQSPGQTVVFSNVGADATQGARGTRVELVCTNMNYKSSAEPINTVREIHLGIINHRGKKNLPWQLGFVGGNAIVNDGVTTNPLTLRIANIAPYNALSPTLSNITFNHDAEDATKTTKIILSFQTGVANDPWAIETDNNVFTHIDISINEKLFPGWNIIKSKQGEAPIWILSPVQTINMPCMGDPVNGSKGHLDININNIISNFPCGQTNLYIFYQNIPGYWDGNEACIIEKTPVRVKQGLVEMFGNSSGENIPFQIVALPKSVGPLMGFTVQTKPDHNENYMVIGSFGSANKIENFNRPLLITNKDGNKQTNMAHFTADGKLAIGNITQPSAVIDVAPVNSVPALQLQNGNHVTGTSENQLVLGYNEPRADHPQKDVFRHAIKTRHTSGATTGNSIDFYIWNYGKDKDTDVGTLHTLSMNGGKVGIGGETEPKATLDVKGDIKCEVHGADAYGMGLTVTNARIWCNSVVGGMWAGTSKSGFFGVDENGYTGLYHKENDTIQGWVIRAKKTASSADVTIHGRLFTETVNQLGESGTRYMVHKPLNNEVGLYDSRDQRLKKNIAPLLYALETIQQLRGVSFNWNEEGLKHKTKDVEDNYRSVSNTPEDNADLWEQQKQRIRQENARTFHGFIAQEVEAVFPDWVKEDKDGYKTINMDELAPVMVEAIKTQQQQINTLQSQIEMLMNELKALKPGSTL